MKIVGTHFTSELMEILRLREEKKHQETSEERDGALQDGQKIESGLCGLF